MAGFILECMAGFVGIRTLVYIFQPKTCSTAERTFDFIALARQVGSGIGLPCGFLRWMRETRVRIRRRPQAVCCRPPSLSSNLALVARMAV